MLYLEDYLESKWKFCDFSSWKWVIEKFLVCPSPFFFSHDYHTHTHTHGVNNQNQTKMCLLTFENEEKTANLFTLKYQIKKKNCNESVRFRMQ